MDKIFSILAVFPVPDIEATAQYYQFISEDIDGRWIVFGMK